jgi:hypothetical protein
MRRVLVLFALSLFGAPSSAQCELSKLVGDDPSAPGPAFDRQFGAGLAMSGTRMAVGAPVYGAVFVYELDGVNWRLAAEIAPPSPDVAFGSQLALDGGTLVVAGTKPDVFVYEEAGGVWSFAGMLVPPGGTADFPSDLDVDGERAVVGDFQLASNDGRVFVFARQGAGTWAHDQTLSPSDFLIERFGASVAISGDRIVVGCQNVEAYAFAFDGQDWVAEPQLGAVATSVAVDGDVAVLGQHFDTTLGVSAGAARILERVGGAWQETAFVTAHDGEVGDQFGFGVDVADGLVVVGATTWDAGGNESNDGAGYAFAKQGGAWVEVARLVPDERGFDDFIGRDVATNGTLAALSAPGDDDEGPNRGAVYVMAPFGAPCRTFERFPTHVSVSSGGTLTMLLRAPQSEAGRAYLVGGSLTGLHPGFALGGHYVPLNPDSWFLFTLTQANGAVLGNTFGLLDAGADATATLTVPPGTTPALVGRKMHHAYLTLDFGPLAVRHASTPIVLRFLP